MKQQWDGEKWVPALTHMDAVLCGIGCCGPGDPCGCDECRPPGIPYPYEIYVEDEDRPSANTSAAPR